MNPDRILFVYRNKNDGTFKVAWIEDCKTIQATGEWNHTATIDPKVWIEALANRDTFLESIT